MNKYIYDKRNGLWYALQGDYYIPCLELPAEKEEGISVYGPNGTSAISKSTAGRCMSLCSPVAN